MSDTAQSYAHHLRFLPPWHYFAFPVFAINAIVMIVYAVRAPSGVTVWGAVMALALLVGLGALRWMSTRLQDRIIRLEERSRLAWLTSGTATHEFDTLRTGQLIGLRFASDAEVVALARRCMAGELKTRADVKQAITQWRPDRLRV